MQNALHTPSIKHNLIPPLIFRETELTVSEVPKIHCDEPMVDDHSIYDDVTKLWIPLKLDGIFSYLPMRALTLEDIQCYDDKEDFFYRLTLKLGIPILRYILWTRNS